MKLLNDLFNVKPRKNTPFAALAALALSLSVVSCESIYDNQDNCVSGLSLAFVYDYHMERGANAFSSNVDCVSVLVFDKDGNYVTQFVETDRKLRDANYRMTLPLEPGDYKLVCYGGLSCDNPTFEYSHKNFEIFGRGSHKNDIRVSLPLDENGISNNQLHDPDNDKGGCFYGAMNLTVHPDDRASTYREETMNLMKNTNNIQVMLQQLNYPYSIDYDEFNFYIIDDNFVLNGENKAVSTVTETSQPMYKPYHSENRVMGYTSPDLREGQIADQDETKPVQVACVEFSTSRLLMDNLATARLVVTSKTEKEKDGSDKVIIDIPLISYLTYIRGWGDSWIKDDQEFLDRQSRWNMMFFLQRNVWVKASVVVNDWTVRMNDVHL